MLVIGEPRPPPTWPAPSRSPAPRGSTPVSWLSAAATPADIDRAAVIVLNDAPPPTGAAARALDAAVKRGTGLLLVLGERASWPQGAPDLLPGTLGATADRLETRGGTLGFVDLSHPVFEVFKTPRSGDLTAARVFRYRS